MADEAPSVAADALMAAIKAASAKDAANEPRPPSVESLTPPAAASPPAKRPRSPTPGGDDDGPVKRLKTEPQESLPLPPPPPPSAPEQAVSASWDISAMLQNALGNVLDSFDEPLVPVADVAEEAGGPPPVTAALQAAAKRAVADKTDQMRMKFSSNPRFVARTMSLLPLGSLAVQILLALAQQPRRETASLLADHNAETWKVFNQLRSSFVQVKRLFSETEAILQPEALDIVDEDDRETIRIANLATSAMSIFGYDDAALADIHRQFYRIFAPEEGQGIEWLAQLFLELNTQVALSALASADEGQDKQELLGKYFREDMTDGLNLGNGSVPLSTGHPVLDDAILRRDLFRGALGAEEQLQVLTEQYPSDRLLDQLGDYLQRLLSTILDSAEKYGINVPVNQLPEVNGTIDTDIKTEQDDLAALPASAASGFAVPQGPTPVADASSGAQPSTAESVAAGPALGLGQLLQDTLQRQDQPAQASVPPAPLANGASSEAQGLASLLAETLNKTSMPDINQTAGSNMHNAYLSHLNQPYYQYQQPLAPQQQQQQQQGSGGSGDSLPPNQTFPSDILYERARAATVAKSSAHARREGLQSTRRPWSQEEEKALMAGLDMVKGPHWSQILTLFGPNGTISDILKDRTQVQLKDKARNLKLFFLKASSEMPFYLKSVTGELKTRAPSQAARKEAEEKARVNSKEEQARIQGIMTLAGGLQNNSRPSPAAAAAAAAGVSAARQAPQTYAAGLAGGATQQSPGAQPAMTQQPADVKTETGSGQDPPQAANSQQQPRPGLPQPVALAAGQTASRPQPQSLAPRPTTSSPGVPHHSPQIPVPPARQTPAAASNGAQNEPPPQARAVLDGQGPEHADVSTEPSLMQTLQAAIAATHST